ncbi:unnamed protein product, partial [Gulo gulo]
MPRELRRQGAGHQKHHHGTRAKGAAFRKDLNSRKIYLTSSAPNPGGLCRLGQSRGQLTSSLLIAHPVGSSYPSALLLVSGSGNAC